MRTPAGASGRQRGADSSKHMLLHWTCDRRRQHDQAVKERSNLPQGCIRYTINSKTERDLWHTSTSSGTSSLFNVKHDRRDKVQQRWSSLSQRTSSRALRLSRAGRSHTYPFPASSSNVCKRDPKNWAQARQCSPSSSSAVAAAAVQPWQKRQCSHGRRGSAALAAQRELEQCALHNQIVKYHGVGAHQLTHSCDVR